MRRVRVSLKYKRINTYLKKKILRKKKRIKPTPKRKKKIFDYLNKEAKRNKG